MSTFLLNPFLCTEVEELSNLTDAAELEWLIIIQNVLHLVFKSIIFKYLTVKKTTIPNIYGVEPNKESLLLLLNLQSVFSELCRGRGQILKKIQDAKVRLLKTYHQMLIVYVDASIKLTHQMTYDIQWKQVYTIWHNRNTKLQ